MGYHLGVDVGTTFTAAAIKVGGIAQILPLSADSTLAPSLVGLHPDGPVVVGSAAAALADYDQRLVASAFKRRMGDPTPIVVGGAPNDASWYMAQVLAWVVGNASHQRGERPESVAVTHPANWHSHKITRMRQAIAGAGLAQDSTVLLTEPEAAAVAYANHHAVALDETLVVYDLGGGTFDTAALRRERTGFTILGRPQGMERLGGLDFDAAVYRYVTNRLGPSFNKLDSNDLAIARQMAGLRRECIAAKEVLSFQTSANITVSVGPLQQHIELTRAKFESLIQPVLMESIGAVRRVLRGAELTSDQISRILLAGGSSRIPMVAEIISSELGRDVSVDDEPKQVVALGAAHAAAASPSAGITHTAPAVAMPADMVAFPRKPRPKNKTAVGQYGSTTAATPPTTAGPSLRPADPTSAKTTRPAPATRRPPMIVGNNNQPPAASKHTAPAPQHRRDPTGGPTSDARARPDLRVEPNGPTAVEVKPVAGEAPKPNVVHAAPRQAGVQVHQAASTGNAWHEPTGEQLLGTATATFEIKPNSRRRALYIGVAGVLLLLVVGAAVVLQGILNSDQPQEAGGSPTSLADSGLWPSTITMSIKTVPGVNIEQLVVVQILEDELGIDIDIRPSTAYSGVADDLATGAAALGILDAFSYSLATDAGFEIEPAAVQTDDAEDPGYSYSYGLTAVDNNDVQSLADFTPGVVCFPDRDSLSGFRMPASGLENVGVDVGSASSPVTPQIAGSDESAVRFIADGTCPVGFVSSEAIDDLLIDGDLLGLADTTGEVGETNPNEATLKVVWLSPKIMNGPLAMSAALPHSLRDAFAETLTNKANRQWAAANGYCRDSGTSCSINSEGGWGYAPSTDLDFDGIRRLCGPASQDGCRP